MKTEEIINVINNSGIKYITDFLNRAHKMFPDIRNVTIINKQDMGTFGILASARFNNGMDDIIVKGYLYPVDNWSEKTHGYVTSKKI